MHSYYIKDFSNKETYCAFICYMLSHSDAFSFIFVSRRSGSEIRKTVREIQNMLAPYKMYSRVTNAWPSMVTGNGEQYVYKLVVYQALPEVETVLSKVDCLFAWDFPEYPMDLCFYRDGYAWFAASSHEQWDALYTDDRSVIRDLSEMGVCVCPGNSVDNLSLFYEPKSNVTKPL